jgi:glycyl-tRNA synthetase (class II)
MAMNAGASLKANIIAAWKRHFVIEENLLEIEDPTIMPHDVLKTSGHVDRYASSATIQCSIPGAGNVNVAAWHTALR